MAPVKKSSAAIKARMKARLDGVDRIRKAQVAAKPGALSMPAPRPTTSARQWFR
jgi:hypothetical protein